MKKTETQRRLRVNTQHQQHGRVCTCSFASLNECRCAHTLTNCTNISELCTMATIQTFNKFVYSLHEADTKAEATRAARSPQKIEPNRYQRSPIWPKSCCCTAWDFHLSFSLAHMKKKPPRFQPIESWSIITYQFLTAVGVQPCNLSRTQKIAQKKFSLSLSPVPLYISPQSAQIIIKLFTFT